MSKRVIIKACLLLAVTSHAQAQYIDFFQNFNSFLQPFTTSRPKNDVTKRPDAKHRQTTKQKYQDAIFFETDDFLKQREKARTLDPFGIYTTTTTKPRRKSTKTSTTSHSHSYTTTNKPNKPDNSNKILNNNINVNHEVIRSISNNDFDNRATNNARRINNGYNNYNLNIDTTRPSYGVNYNDRQTTQRTTTTINYYNPKTTQKVNVNGYNTYNFNSETTRPNSGLSYNNNNRPTTQRTTTTINYYHPKTTQKVDYYGRQTTNIYDSDRTTRRPNNKHTTRNPLLNRPGVKPAVVDENRPPITNRPVTERPAYDRPYDSGIYRPNTLPPIVPRPVNTRPPYETERPISTGVARPVSSGSTSNENTEVDIEIGPDEDDMSDAEKRRLYDICERKCDEYKAMRVKKVVALPLAGDRSGVEVNVSSCTPDTAPLIIGGQLARIETFPHMALVGWKNVQGGGYAWKCGGSLLSERYVLTAGHCTYHDKDYNVVSGPPAAVQLGSSIYNDLTATVVQVSLVVRHPKYKLRRSYHDVALIKMAVDVSFSDTIMPACLGVPPSVGEPIVATGWGKTEYGGDSSIQLRSVSIPIWDMNDCRDIWGTSLKLPNGPMPDNQICAGERRGAKDTCQGDSGGPAQVRDACLWRVVAVTSVGRSCGAPETPALYARVPRAFIAKQVYTNIKTGRDGNSDYGNAGNNANNNWNSGNNNWNTGNNNWNSGNNNGGTQGEATIPPQNNNQNYNNGRGSNDNGQYYGDNYGSSTDNRGAANNGNGNNNWYTNKDNQYNGNNRNVYDTNYSNNNNGQTTSNYNSFGRNNDNYNVNSYGQNQNGRINENPSDIRTYDTSSYSYNDNGRINNGYNRDNDNGYNNRFPVANRPWWTR